MSEPRPDVSTLLSACRDAGAEQAEALVEESEHYATEEDPNGRRRLSPRHEWRCWVRVSDAQGRVGAASVAGRLSDGPVALAQKAMARAKKAKVQDHGGPAVRLDVPDRGLGIRDLRLPDIDDDARLEVVEMNMEGARDAVDGVEALSFIYKELRRTRSFAATNGVLASEESSSFSLTGTLRDRHNDGLSLTDTSDSRHFADVASVPLGIDLARRLASYRVSQQLPDAPNGLIIDPLAIARLLPALAPAFSAERIDAGDSFLAGRLGKALGSPKLHIIDDAGLSGALMTRAFDDRGVPAVAVPLLREGVAESIYMGPALAHARGLRPTGHEHADGSLWPGNLVVRSGTRSRNMLLPDMGSLVAIADFLDLSGVDLKAGTLDLPVRVMAMEGSTILGCAGESHLRCTIADFLGSVIDVCSDQERIRDVDACTWICQGLMVE